MITMKIGACSEGGCGVVAVAVLPGCHLPATTAKFMKPGVDVVVCWLFHSFFLKAAVRAPRQVPPCCTCRMAAAG